MGTYNAGGSFPEDGVRLWGRVPGKVSKTRVRLLRTADTRLKGECSAKCLPVDKFGYREFSASTA